MIDFSEAGPQIPDCCMGCPELNQIKSMFIQNVAIRQSLEVLSTEFVMDENAVPAEVIESFAEFMEASASEVKPEFDRLREYVGNQAAEAFEKIDEVECEALVAAEALLANCHGQLDMHGVTKLGREVVVTVCGSNIAPVMRDAAEDAIVTRYDTF